MSIVRCDSARCNSKGWQARAWLGEGRYLSRYFADRSHGGSDLAYKVIVTGQHCPGHAGSWLIGVANWDPDAADTDFPRWPMRIEPQNYRNGFQPSLVIEAPEGVTLTCLQRHGSDEG